MTDDELIDIEEREAIAVQDMEPATAQAAWEYRVEKAKEKYEMAKRGRETMGNNSDGDGFRVCDRTN